MADFTKRSNYVSDAGIDNVVFGANAPLLETELNEIQMIRSDKLKRLIANFIGDGLSDLTAISYDSVNSTFTLNECYATAGGEIVKCTGATISTTDVANIYLKIWREIIGYNAVLKTEGNQDSVSTVTNYMIDGRVGTETSRREVVKYQLVTTKPVEDTTSKYLKLATISNNVMTVVTGSSNVSAMVNQIRQELNNGDYDTPISNTNTITEVGTTALDAVQNNPTVANTLANRKMTNYPDTAEYSASATYAVGVMAIVTITDVKYLKVCSSAISTPEVYNAAHWANTSEAGFVTNTTDTKVYKVGADSVLKKCSSDYEVRTGYVIVNSRTTFAKPFPVGVVPKIYLKCNSTAPDCGYTWINNGCVSSITNDGFNTNYIYSGSGDGTPTTFNGAVEYSAIVAN